MVNYLACMDGSQLSVAIWERAAQFMDRKNDHLFILTVHNFEHYLEQERRDAKAREAGKEVWSENITEDDKKGYWYFLVEYDKAVMKKARNLLAACVDKCKRVGIECTPILKSGDPKLQILEMQKDHNCDFVFLGHHSHVEEAGGGKAWRVMCGSVARHVLKKCPVPIMVVKEIQHPEHGSKEKAIAKHGVRDRARTETPLVEPLASTVVSTAVEAESEKPKAVERNDSLKDIMRPLRKEMEAFEEGQESESEAPVANIAQEPEPETNPLAIDVEEAQKKKKKNRRSLSARGSKIFSARGSKLKKEKEREANDEGL